MHKIFFCLYMLLLLGGCVSRISQEKKYEIWVGLMPVTEHKEEEYVFVTPKKAWDTGDFISSFQIKVENENFYKIYQKFLSAPKQTMYPTDCCYLRMMIKENHKIVEVLAIHHPHVGAGIVGAQEKDGVPENNGIASTELANLFYASLIEELKLYELDFSSMIISEEDQDRLKEGFNAYIKEDIDVKPSTDNIENKKHLTTKTKDKTQKRLRVILYGSHEE